MSMAGHAAEILAVAWHAASSHILTTDIEGCVAVWRPSEGSICHRCCRIWHVDIGLKMTLPMLQQLAAQCCAQPHSCASWVSGFLAMGTYWHLCCVLSALR